MTQDERVPRPPTDTNRTLLNLGGGNRRGLERAFQTLVGRTRPVATPTVPTAPFLKVLHDLGFTSQTLNGATLLTHPMAPDRQFSLEIEGQPDPDEWAFAWVTRYLPQMEFYLPYITLRARLARAHATTGQRAPEPDYDEDGFLADYS